MCREETIPDDFDEIVDKYASQGFRIIGLGCRHLLGNMARAGRISKMTRPEIESELTFLGLIILENRIKPASSAVFKVTVIYKIHHLHSGLNWRLPLFSR